MSWDTILFDLDGTLTDPGVGITKAVYRALTGMGVAVEDLNSLKMFIGPPLDEAFAEYYGFSVQQSEEAVLLFREYYNEVGWLENIPYDGIEVLLKKLRACGKRLAVATSKPENIALRVLNYFSLAPYFDCICGAPPDNPAEGRKAAVIRNALLRLEIADIGRAIMVGDRRHDVQGAHEAGLKAIGVLYGYGERRELEEAGAEWIAEDLSVLGRLLEK